MKREDFHEEDTLPPRPSGLNDWWRRNEGWLFWVVVALMLGAVFLLPGCADTSRITVSQNERGELVRVLELPAIECPHAVSNGANNGGCVWHGPVTFGYGWDSHARVHELVDHIGGLKHGPWKNDCAPILAGGITQWKVGNLICRHAQGHYYQK